MDTLPPPVEADCGKYCAAFSFLSPDVPIAPFSFAEYKSGLMLAFDANPSVWNEVQCMSVTDSFTSTRACCECDDYHNCPYWGYAGERSSYCSLDENNTCTTSTCKQLAAGCGINLYDLAGQANGGDWNQNVGEWGQTDWHEQSCNEWDVRSGNCALCTIPNWCNDPYSTIVLNGTSRTIGWAAHPRGAIATPEDWIDEFFDKDGGHAFGARQCKWKPSQKEIFVATMRLRFAHRANLTIDERGRHFDHANTWNEVNMYVPPGDDKRFAQLMFDNLLGLVYVRNSGDDDELDQIQDLAAHWRKLGRDVPMFALTSEEIEKVKVWSPDVRVDLLSANYTLREIGFDEKHLKEQAEALGGNADE